MNEEMSCIGCEYYNEEDDVCMALDCNLLTDCDKPLPCEINDKYIDN